MANSWPSRLKEIIFGKPRSLFDQTIFHRLSLIPFLAWVGLGADGLSSSSYGPEETFKALGTHTYLVVPLALLMIFTITIISAAYSRIISAFPHGGGGYVVASKLLGRRVGVVSGCALLVDYALTITTSVAAAGAALFSFLPPSYQSAKLVVEIFLILFLTTLNLRGVRESVVILAPIFLVFLVTHAITLVWAIVAHIPEFPATVNHVSTGFSNGLETLGPMALIMLMLHAYSLGGGTYTGIEAVSNGLPIMREPRVQTARRTMLYMGASLAITASGLFVAYLLWNVQPQPGKTMNAVLLESIAGTAGWGAAFVVVTLLAQALLLIVAAQAGFIDGPRVLANMAVDSWMPKQFSALSERLTTANGIVLMGAASLAALLYTRGDVSSLVVMYSINVFLTFSLSIGGMLKATIQDHRGNPRWRRDIALFGVGFVLCVLILIVTVHEKFFQGGWVTLIVTGTLVSLSFYIHKHYATVATKLMSFNAKIDSLPKLPACQSTALDPKARTAAVLVASFGALGVNTVKSILSTFPGVFENFIFVSIGVVDSGGFKGEGAIEELEKATKKALQKYVDFCREYNLKADYRMAVGTDIVQSGYDLALEISKEFTNTTFFAGKVIFEEEEWYHRILHNETALSLQKRLQLSGHTMVVLPTRIG